MFQSNAAIGCLEAPIGNHAIERAAIGRLPSRLREVLILRAIEGLSQAEAAEALGVTEKSVETRLYRARRRLAELVGMDGAVSG